jgi:Domain of unknown function (DUF397)
MEDTIELRWRKASYSGNGGGSCVEVGIGVPGKVAVRDSKDREGPMLTVSARTWSQFTEGIKQGKFDL